tara:strand:- start:1167 stop:2177 length:1011 start_codon:yes stop_codon:yes gene_type:complete
MNNIKLIFLCFPFFGYSQVTPLPDYNFELALVNLGFDNLVDGFVLNSRIDTIDSLVVPSCNIESLIGIDAFLSLTYLDCSSNNIDTLDLTNNYLKYLDCSANQLVEIDVSNHLNLQTFKCSFNKFVQIDVSLNTSLIYFECFENRLVSLDISNNIFLRELWCNNNNLTNLDIAGIDMYVLICDDNQLTSINNLSDNISLRHLSCSENNISSLNLSTHTQLNWLSCSKNQLFQLDISALFALNYFFAWDNPNLNCIAVNNVSFANANWLLWDGQLGNIDGHHYFSTNCILSSTFQINQNKQISSVINLKGQQSLIFKNKPLFYKYNDGSYEYKIIIE